mmetsp:Transcript_37215/g.42479  ORF Transcript_37215/g.42479 Transcript_37215/m.42479 type:complete len:442 (-) Transcript_37215:449-1774(-)
MVSAPYRRKSVGGKGLNFNYSTVIIILVLFSVLAFYIEFHHWFNMQEIRTRNENIEVKSHVAPSPITSWAQIEDQMNRINPKKARHFREFLESSEVDPVKGNSVEELDTTLDSLEDQRASLNSELIQKWRGNFEEAAATKNSEQHRSRTKEFATNAFTVKNLRKCKHVILDFGSNIGDSLIKIIDSSLPEFDSGVSPDGKKLHHSLNVKSGNVGDGVYDFRKGDPKWILPKWIKQTIHNYNVLKKNQFKTNHVHPEDYCFYGVEGNPHFTSLLREQEIQIMNMVPRPIRHIHFLTEHIGAGSDGPTILYLDTVNKKQNFWGSSIFNTHIDVVSSGPNTGVPVMGITLTRLLKETVLPGGHVLIKIDIEGGEYQLLEEAINSSIFCNLTRVGVKIDMLSEFHNAKVVGSEEPIKKWKEMEGEKKIKKCGVGYGWGKFTQFMR